MLNEIVYLNKWKWSVFFPGTLFHSNNECAKNGVIFLLNAKNRLLDGEINKVFEKRELFLKPIIYVITVFISNEILTFFNMVQRML